MDVREKLVELVKLAGVRDKGVALRIADCLVINGVTIHEWIPVKDHTPTEADGTVWVCLADVFPYNEKEPYIDAKHDRRITEAFYSQFSKRWYKNGAVFADGVVTHWMPMPRSPKGE